MGSSDGTVLGDVEGVCVGSLDGNIVGFRVLGYGVDTRLGFGLGLNDG